MNFPRSIIEWYGHNKRDLPWRNTKDAYKIWISEIILQQTRVEFGQNIILNFFKNFQQFMLCQMLKKMKF